MTRQVEVIQADREAAAPYVYGHTGLYSKGHLVLTGQLDDHQIVQAFARHRLQCTSGWQPIETAPKDGSPVLLCRPPHSDAHALHRWASLIPAAWCAYIDEDDVEQSESGFVTPDELFFNPYDPAEYQRAINDGDHYLIENATHWRPLPSPPHSAGEGE